MLNNTSDVGSDDVTVGVKVDTTYVGEGDSRIKAFVDSIAILRASSPNPHENCKGLQFDSSIMYAGIII